MDIFVKKLLLCIISQTPTISNKKILLQTYVQLIESNGCVNRLALSSGHRCCCLYLMYANWRIVAGLDCTVAYEWGPQVSSPTEMGTEPKDVLVVMVTAANQEEAARISDQVVRAHQAACATTIPMVYSTYWWEGKLMSDQESLILLKTTIDKFPSLQETIQKIHSYTVPEIIAIPVTKGLPQYLEWVQREIS